MERKESFAISVLLLFLLSAVPARPQGGNTITGAVKGVVSRNAEPLADMRVVFTNPNNGKQYKTKTAANGEYFSAGMALETFKVEVLGANGEVLYTNTVTVRSTGGSVTLNIDVGNPSASGGMAGGTVERPKMTKEEEKAEAARMKAYNDKLPAMNALLGQAQAAMQAQKWPDAEKALKQLLATNPETSRWEFYKALGDAQGRNGEWQDAIKTYDAGIQTAQAIISGKAPKDPGNPSPDPARAKTGISQMLIAEGNAYVKLDKPEMSAPLFQQAALDNPNPGLAYYNLCAVLFNAGKWDDAIASCDKAIAADATRAEAWFLKGTALYKISQPGSTARPGTVEALNKYLQLDPNGSHAAEAKTILQTVAQK
ncbi:MAG TPA: tetratricopeptide repeat protein [Candidatus Angelobacter sp.]|nr:tetratricopeptide repeat protein [Candidatus Angelobacter sp.]